MLHKFAIDINVMRITSWGSVGLLSKTHEVLLRLVCISGGCFSLVRLVGLLSRQKNEPGTRAGFSMDVVFCNSRQHGRPPANLHTAVCTFWKQL
jgi:hypothetical protein